jgi:hypothetical protein
MHIERVPTPSLAGSALTELRELCDLACGRPVCETSGGGEHALGRHKGSPVFPPCGSLIARPLGHAPHRRLFELTFDEADDDWTGTRVGFALAPFAIGTEVRFSHCGWPRENEHYRVSCHCWALCLRPFRRHAEHGESVPYETRLDA